MWQVLEHRRVSKQLEGKVPLEVLKRYEKWKDIVSLSGMEGLRAIKGFHDEALSGQWQGYRSSRLGDKWRVIYQIIDTECKVFVIEVTPHDYRRR